MPIIFKQIEELLGGDKTQSRRVAKPDEWAVFADGDMFHPQEFMDDPGYFDEMTDMFGSYEVRAVLTPSERVKWKVGQEHAIIPKRGKPALWLDPDGQIVDDWRDIDLPLKVRIDYYKRHGNIEQAGILRTLGYRQPKVIIERIRLENIHDITTEDAIAEGYPYDWPPGDLDRVADDPPVGPVGWYRDLWRSINTRKGTRWEDCPLVWVLDVSVTGTA